MRLARAVSWYTAAEQIAAAMTSRGELIEKRLGIDRIATGPHRCSLAKDDSRPVGRPFPLSLKGRQQSA